MDNSFQYSDFVATTLSGLEPVCAAELIKLGGTQVEPLVRAVKFKGDKKLMYRANYEIRTALRILKPLAYYEAKDATEFYTVLSLFPWENIFSCDKTFAIEVVGSHPSFTNTVFAIQRCKDAIVDRFRKLFDKRPSVDLDEPDIKIHLYLQPGKLSVSLDSSGEPLFKRGYRKGSVPAPLNEVLAAGLIWLSGWDSKTDFFDPFCGSGTIPIEASMIATQTPAGKFRQLWGFMKWNDFEPELWKDIKAQADALVCKQTCNITASDFDSHNLDVAKRNIGAAGFRQQIKTELSSFANFNFPTDLGFIVANPPYGERMRPFDMVELYKSIGDTLKHKCAGYQAWLIGSDFAALKFIGLKPSAKKLVFNGPLECKFLQFKIFSGSRKDLLSGTTE